MILWAALAGCGTPEPAACDTVSWDRTARPFLDTWCTPCHSSQVPASDRQGAPLGVDYDGYVAVLDAAASIVGRISGDQPSMPPGGGLPLDARDRFVIWLECGAPGSDTPTAAPCDGAQEVAAFDGCTEEPVRVTGSMAATGNDVSCVCEVSGDLTVSGDADFENLRQVAGAVSIQGAAEVVRFSSLTEAGSLTIDAPSLGTLALERLRVVRGDVTVTRAATPRLPLGGLVTVEGGLSVTGADVQQISLDRIESVGGPLSFQDMPALLLITGTHGLTTVGGPIRFETLPALTRLDSFSALDAPGGALRIAETGITALRGFDRLRTVPGLEIESNPALQLFDGLADLTHVAGDLGLVDNGALEEIASLVFLSSVGGDFVLRDHESLGTMLPLEAMEAVGGDVTVTGNPALRSSDVERAFEGVEVGGSILIDP